MFGTHSVTAGYVILGLLGLLDTLGFLLASGDDGPPVVINAVGTPCLAWSRSGGSSFSSALRERFPKDLDMMPKQQKRSILESLIDLPFKSFKCRWSCPLC